MNANEKSPDKPQAALRLVLREALGFSLKMHGAAGPRYEELSYAP